MADALAFAFTAALNPTLLAATMVMLFAAEPRRLMTGYLLGAYTASISIGLVIVFALQDSGAVQTTQHTIGPAADVVLGLLFVLVAVVVRSDRDTRHRERRARSRSEPRDAPRWRRALDTGSPRTAFLVGILLTLPGASYLVGMTRISQANATTIATALAVIAFCVIMLLLIEIPLLGFVVAPDVTRRGVTRFTDWVSSNARAIIARAALVIGLALLVRAAIEFLT
ncbi:GAP family protein [Solirubrobacter soli]|uniref:GAP family protein n=1 Tax=Solirubrobacter soli TaxID=363832 RepID=UPI0003F63D02|nr:GAP family protein [Solirubrobacter soli]